MNGPSDHHPLAPLVAAAVTAGTMAIAFGLLALGVDSFWVAFVLGFGGVLPVSLGVLQYAHRTDGRSTDWTADARSASDDSATPLAELRHRYARGDITEAEFERRLERLLETESGPVTPASDER